MFRNRGSLEHGRLVSAVALVGLGMPRMSPPAAAKQRHLLRLVKERKHRVFVEAGTYKGATSGFIARHVDQVMTVELHDELYEKARRRFEGSNVRVVHGDSLVEIPKLVAECTSPPLVFLDGHYSGEGTATGVEMEPAKSTLGELASVTPPGSTIVIDDLRLFGSGTVGFPQLDEICAAARKSFPDALIRVGLDCIVVEA